MKPVFLQLPLWQPSQQELDVALRRLPEDAALDLLRESWVKWGLTIPLQATALRYLKPQASGSRKELISA